MCVRATGDRRQPHRNSTHTTERSVALGGFVVVLLSCGGTVVGGASAESELSVNHTLWASGSQAAPCLHHQLTPRDAECFHHNQAPAPPQQPAPGGAQPSLVSASRSCLLHQLGEHD